LYSGHPPFQLADPRDPHYKLIASNRADLFWKTHESRKVQGFYSDDFKDLITNMLQLLPNQRLSMADIIGHPWMQGEMATRE
jgi:BR serine/threonine kinase/MAP/microtubule affinity-regulating kinase